MTWSTASELGPATQWTWETQVSRQFRTTKPHLNGIRARLQRQKVIGLQKHPRANDSIGVVRFGVSELQVAYACLSSDTFCFQSESKGPKRGPDSRFPHGQADTGEQAATKRTTKPLEDSSADAANAIRARSLRERHGVGGRYGATRLQAREYPVNALQRSTIQERI
jgi:hypothetical protein